MTIHLFFCLPQTKCYYVTGVFLFHVDLSVYSCLPVTDFLIDFCLFPFFNFLFAMSELVSCMLSGLSGISNEFCLFFLCFHVDPLDGLVLGEDDVRFCCMCGNVPFLFDEMIYHF